MNTAELSQRVDEVIELGKAALARQNTTSTGHTNVDLEVFYKINGVRSLILQQEKRPNLFFAV